MNIVVDERPENVAVVSFEGRLDFLATTHVKQRLYQIVDGGFSRLVIDLEKVTFIDSSGLTTLISGLKSARLAGGDLRVANPGDEARTILELTRLDQVMQIFPSVEDAVSSF